MKLKEDIKPISYIKSHAAEVLSKINTTHRPTIITQNGEAKGVLIDTESYERMNKVIMYLKLLSQSENDIKNEDVSSSSTVFKKLKTKIDAQKE